MKRLILIVFFLSISTQICLAKTEEQVTSTQGIENLDSTAIEKSQLSTQEKNEQKDKINRSKECIKLKNKTKKLERKKLHEEKEQKFLEYRLELKKQKLEQFNSDTEKGEN
jgi:hypothetical protein